MWERMYAGEKRYRVPLPTYPFDRQHFWVDARPGTPQSIGVVKSGGKRSQVADWFYMPSWKRTIAISPINHAALQTNRQHWLIFADVRGVGKHLAGQFLELNQDVVMVAAGEQFARKEADIYTMDPRRFDHYERLLAELQQSGRFPERIVHLWVLNTQQMSSNTALEESLVLAQDLGLRSLLFLAEALDKVNVSWKIQLDVISNALYDVTGSEQLELAQALIIGGCKTIPQEYPHINCRNLDLEITRERDLEAMDQLVHALVTEDASWHTVALRGKHRWQQSFEPVPLPNRSDGPLRLRDQGTYLITGGLGGIGLHIASYLAHNVQARIALLGRSEFPQPEAWHQWQAAHRDDDAVSRKIQVLQPLRERGVEILILQADIANETEMKQALHTTVALLGENGGQS